MSSGLYIRLYTEIVLCINILKDNTGKARSVAKEMHKTQERGLKIEETIDLTG